MSYSLPSRHPVYRFGASAGAIKLALLASVLASLAAPASAEIIGLRVSPRGAVIVSDTTAPASLRFNISRSNYSAADSDGMMPVSPLLLGLPQTSAGSRGNGVWADWFPFDSGLRTSAGLVWGDNRRGSNLFDQPTDSGLHSRGFLGFGWTTSAASSSTGTRWRLDADVGASFGSLRDCTGLGAQCIGAGPGLKLNSGGDGIRWNPFISIGASIDY